MKKIAKRLVILFLILFIVLPAANGCTFFEKEITEIHQIAYNENEKGDNIIYIKEDGEYTPYIALESNYSDSGSTILLREEIYKYDMLNDYYSYYEDCYIDKYLNEEFINVFDDEFKDKITDFDLVITAKSSLGLCGEKVKTINRRVFLLSVTEIGHMLGNTENTIVGKEGRPIKYFTDNYKNRIACKDGEPSSWWLRSPNTWEINCSFCVGPDGKLAEGGNTYNTNGIRPAFCIKDNSKIAISEEVITGEQVYIFCNSKKQIKRSVKPT